MMYSFSKTATMAAKKAIASKGLRLTPGRSTMFAVENGEMVLMQTTNDAEGRWSGWELVAPLGVRVVQFKVPFWVFAVTCDEISLGSLWLTQAEAEGWLRNFVRTFEGKGDKP